MKRIGALLASIGLLGCGEEQSRRIDTTIPQITEATREEARRNPSGHVYAIDGDFGPRDAVPPEAIVGAWAVDGDGNITGDFIPNPNYRPSP